MSLFIFAQKFVNFGIDFYKLSDRLLSEIKPESITFLQFQILQVLYSDKTTNLSRLCNCIGMTLPNTSREIKKLYEKKLVEKTTDSTDKRIQYIELSKEGIRLLSEAYEKLEKNIAERYKNLNGQELMDMIKALDLLNKNLIK